MRLRATLVVALLLLAGLLAANGARWYQTTDFFCLYQGSRSLVVGHDPYDEKWWSSIAGGLYPNPSFLGGEAPSSCPGRYGYPLWTAVAMLPFGVLPLELSATLWAALSIGSVVYGMAWSWRAMSGDARLAPVYATIVVASQPFWVLLISGQMSGIETGIAGGVALALARGRSAWAGGGLALMALKPQVVAVTLPGLVVAALRRDRRLALAVVLAVAVMLLVPLAFVGAWPLEWLGELGTRRLRVAGLLPTAWGMGSDLFGTAAAGAVAIGLLALVVWLLLRRRTITLLDAFVLSLPLSLFVTPYAWSYDHLSLAVTWAYVLTRSPAAGARRVAALVGIAVLAVVLPWGLYVYAFTRGTETISAVVPAINTIAVAYAIRARALDASAVVVRAAS